MCVFVRVCVCVCVRARACWEDAAGARQVDRTTSRARCALLTDLKLGEDRVERRLHVGGGDPVKLGKAGLGEERVGCGRCHREQPA